MEMVSLFSVNKTSTIGYHEDISTPLGCSRSVCMHADTFCNELMSFVPLNRRIKLEMTSSISNDSINLDRISSFLNAILVKQCKISSWRSVGALAGEEEGSRRMKKNGINFSVNSGEVDRSSRVSCDVIEYSATVRRIWTHSARRGGDFKARSMNRSGRQSRELKREERTASPSADPLRRLFLKRVKLDS